MPTSLRKIRLLCIGGDDHHLRIPFLLELRRQGFDVAAAGTGDPSAFAAADIRYRGYAFRRTLSAASDAKAVVALSRIIREVGPDVVQTFDTKPNLLVPLARRHGSGWRLVRTINGMGWIFATPSLFSGAMRPVYRAMQRIAAPRTDLTVFQNDADRSYFVSNRMARPEACRVVGGSGIDVDRFLAARASAPAPEAIRARLGIGNVKVVVTATRLTRLKGIATLLAAATLVRKLHPDVCFLLIGPLETEGRFAIRKEMFDRHQPYVRWLGPRDDIPALLSVADMFVLPTEYREGLPRVLLEAALAELPIVTTAMPGCMSVVRHRDNGLLVPPRDPGFLAAQILTLLHDPAAARAMGRRGADLVREEFDLRGVAARYAGLYRQVVETPCVEPLEQPVLIGGAGEFRS